MDKDVLQNKQASQIYLSYKAANGLSRKELVNIRFMDTKTCLLSGSLPANFVKPKRKTEGQLDIYTEEGRYKAIVKINDANMSLKDVLYEIELPKTYDFIQLRSSSRKRVELYFDIKFSDDSILKAETYDLSLGGFSFYSKQNLNTVQQSFPAQLTMLFPDDGYIKFPDNKLITNVKYKRKKLSDEFSEGFFYVFTFQNLSEDDKMILKNFLITICD